MPEGKLLRFKGKRSLLGVGANSVMSQNENRSQGPEHQRSRPHGKPVLDSLSNIKKII